MIHTHNLRSLMDLLRDNGNPLPKNLMVLEHLTPYGTLIRYEEPNEDIKIKRRVVRTQIMRLRKWVEGKIEGESKKPNH